MKKQIDFNSNLLPSKVRPCTYSSFVWYDMIDLDNEAETNNCKVDEIEINYEGFQKELSDMVVGYYESEYNQYLIEAGIKIIAKEKTTMVSPKEYNFATDSVDFIVEYDIDKLIEFINIDNHQYEFHQFCQHNYTSRDGFMSWTPNSVQGIRDSLLIQDDSFDQSIGAIISYILCEVEDVEDIAFADITDKNNCVYNNLLFPNDSE